MLNTVTYHLTRTGRNTDTINGFQRIIDYLLTFVGDVEVKKESENTVYITYPGTDITSTLKTDTSPKLTDSQITGQITLVCDTNDTVSINLIKNITGNIGYRIYNPKTNSFLVNDKNIIDLSTSEVDTNISKIFVQYQLTPLFKYNDSLVFFAKDKKGQIHLVNRHLLEYLIQNNETKKFEKEFSVVIAKDISRFVALMDRGLIPHSFHKYVTSDRKILNLSGLNIDETYRDINVNFVYFSFDSQTQSFNQVEFANLPTSLKIKSGKSLKQELDKTFNINGKNEYLCLKVAQDINYLKEKNDLIPKINISIFMDN